MRIRTVICGLALLVLLPLTASAATWEVDTGHSSVNFSIRHFVSNVHGRFTDFTGVIQYDAANPANSSVEFTVQAKSIDTADAKRDEHLRAPDFFDVAQYPTLSFKSTSVKSAGENKLDVTGDFTLHGVTKSITVPVTYLGAIDLQDGKAKAGFETAFTIDRKDYGIVWNRALDQGGAVLGDEVKINIQVEANRK